MIDICDVCDAKCDLNDGKGGKKKKRKERRKYTIIGFVLLETVLRRRVVTGAANFIRCQGIHWYPGIMKLAAMAKRRHAFYKMAYSLELRWYKYTGCFVYLEFRCRIRIIKISFIYIWKYKWKLYSFYYLVWDFSYWFEETYNEVKIFQYKLESKKKMFYFS